MPSPRFKKGAKPGPGRPKGLQNKTTLAAKQALEKAFDGIGGVDALQEWARANRGEFYKIWSRLIPREVTGADGGPIRTEHAVGLSPATARILRVIAGRRDGVSDAIVVQDRPVLPAEVRDE